jgi:hypothetical protein
MDDEREFTLICLGGKEHVVKQKLLMLRLVLWSPSDRCQANTSLSVLYSGTC